MDEAKIDLGKIEDILNIENLDLRSREKADQILTTISEAMGLQKSEVAETCAEDPAFRSTFLWLVGRPLMSEDRRLKLREEIRSKLQLFFPNQVNTWNK